MNSTLNCYSKLSIQADFLDSHRSRLCRIYPTLLLLAVTERSMNSSFRYLAEATRQVYFLISKLHQVNLYAPEPRFTFSCVYFIYPVFTLMQDPFSYSASFTVMISQISLSIYPLLLDSTFPKVCLLQQAT